MKEFYYQYRKGDDQQSGLVAAADKHAAYSQIRDLLENQNLDTDADHWEYVRVDDLLDA